MKTSGPNRLFQEKSPYLLQHAHNPVDWYPWGDEAFEKARNEEKPIFLSIGYSTCYWCHVMEREVFENDSIAQLMNKYVVSIKVDREERPDIDRVYMTALMAIAGQGGWPMSMFLTPDGKPFFGATYIPPEPRMGRPGFAEIVERIQQVWANDRQKILDTGEQLKEYLMRAAHPPPGEAVPGLADLDRGFEAFEKIYDETNTGFGPAPKFPRPVTFNFLFRYHSRTANEKALSMSLDTLRRMSTSGMYDHIGGGFHRYATDENWHVPHFEKMLYDQAQLIVSYLEAFQITGDHRFAGIARDILEYVERDMTHPEGGFYSAEDAESVPDASEPTVKKEGAFYTWNQKDIDLILDQDEASLFSYVNGISGEGNVVADPMNEFRGLNILHIVHSPTKAAEKFGKDSGEVDRILTSARKKLLGARSGRVRPHLDDKVLASWNGLMISACARASQVLGESRYLEMARRAAHFVLDKMYEGTEKRLLRRYREGDARFEATLEDYAFLTQGLIDLYEASFEIAWLKTAVEFTERQISLFYDTESGGFFDSSGSDPTVLVRTRESYDGAEPSGNSISILNLLRLSHMTGNERYRNMADASLRFFGDWITKAPHGMPQFLVALDFSLSKPAQIIVAGKSDEAGTDAILKEVHKRFVPNRVLLLADGGEGGEYLAPFVPFIGTLTMVDGKPTAYVCQNYACDLPTTEARVVGELLEKVVRKAAD